MAEVELRNITKTFQQGKVTAVKEFSLKVADGAFATILGPSGCGKTTVLRIVAGLERADEGQIMIGGKRVDHLSPAKRNIAMVFQNYALYPHKNVFDNISAGLKFRKVGKEKIKKLVSEVSGMLGIEELLDRFPKQLSGGQQQRVALARALVREPDVFLMDEPLSNLDAQIRDATRSELKKLFKDLKATVLYVTHDQMEAMTMSDLMVLMAQKEIKQIGDPKTIYGNPTHRFVAEFIGEHRINMIPGEIKEGYFTARNNSLVVETALENTKNAFLAIRPEYLELNPVNQISANGAVVLVEPLGRVNIVSIKMGEIEIKALSKESPAMGETVAFSFSPGDAFFFEAETGNRLR